ncbi:MULTISPECIES: cadherin-like domain-containing protein, partial [Trichocoleus]
PTTGNPVRLEIEAGTGSSSPYNLTNVNGTLYFSATNSANGSELWKIDPATSNPVRLEIEAGPGSSYPSSLTNVDGTLYFRAYNSTNGYELWKIDSSTGSPVLVSDIYPGTSSYYDYYSGGYSPNSSYPSSLTNVDGTLYFRAYNSTNGYELWKIDSSTGSPVLVSDIYPGTSSYYDYYSGGYSPNSSDPSSLTNVNGTLYFRAYNSTNGSELWKIDPATGSPVRLEIEVGTGSSSPDNLTNVNGTLYFVATNSSNGRELWKINPQTNSPELVVDFNSGVSSSNPVILGFENDNLYLSADNGANGPELWVLDVTNDAPVLSSISKLGNEDTPITFTISDFTTAFSDADGDSLSKIKITALPANGILKLGENAVILNQEVAVSALDTLTFVPAANFNGTVSFGWNGFDGKTYATTSTTFTLAIASINDVPTLTSTPAALPNSKEDTAYIINVADLLQDFSDMDGDILSIADLAATNGALIDNNNGSYTFIPTENFNGTINLSYSVVDGNGGSVTATQSITIAPVNDAPVVANAIADQTAKEDTAFSFTIPSDTFTDVDAGNTLTYSATLVDGSALPLWLTFDTTTRTFSGTPENGDVDSFSVKVIATDGSGAAIEDIFTLAISNTNDAPTLDATATSISYTDSSNDDSFDVFGGELTSTDPDVGDTATYGITEGDDNNDGTISKTGLYGTLTVDKETGAYTFTPNDDAIEALKDNSSEAFTLLVTDASGATATQKLTIDLAGVNDTASISGTQIGSVTEDITVIDGALTASGTLSVSDRDTGDAKFSTTVTPVGSVLGSLTITEAGAWAYNVDNSAVQSLGQNVTKLEKFTVTSIDSTATQEITVTITGTNDAPTGSPTVTLTSGTEDTAYTINKADLLAGFSDVDGDSFSVSNLTANDVVLTADSNGNYVFTPPANFNGSVTLNYNVVDGKGGSRAATQSFALAPVNDAAVLSSANVALSETNAVLSTSGKLSISDVDNTAEFVAQADVAGSYGQFSIDKDGTWSYAANEAYNSLNVGDSVADTFTVKAVDGTATSVQVTISGTNDAPTATNDNLITSEDIPLVISAATLLGNDVDVDLGDMLSVTTVTQPSQGGLVDNGNGTYTYTPNANYNGVDSFAYTMRDREGATSTATVNLTINAVNDNPDAINDIVTARQSTAKTILAADLLANDADIEGDALNLTQVQNAQNGTVALDSNGNVVFTANANVATASFEYTLSDGKGGTDIAFVSVLVGMVDDGGNGQDTMNGTAGDDVLNGGNGDDILRGFAGDDKLLGGNGIDNLQGGEGKDWLYGGRGNDLLNGGLGRDTFVLISQNGTDTIQDFTDGEDQIGLAEGLTFGQLTVSSSNGNTLIAKNGGDVLAILSGVNSSLITQADFISVV